jgi:hypothetical protein
MATRTQRAAARRAARTRMRTQSHAARSRAAYKALSHNPWGTVTTEALSRGSRQVAARRGHADLSRAATRAARTKGPRGRSQAARKAARSRRST